MKSIRTSVFETNSSSTHSICVSKGNMLDQKQNHVEFVFGEFGWEYETYSDVYRKASYLYTGIMRDSNEELLDKVKTILDSNNITYEFETPEFKTYEYNGKTIKYATNGYIDHDMELDDFLTICDDENKLMNYLFSSESFIVTGNDNSEDDFININVNYDHEEYYKGN